MMQPPGHEPPSTGKWLFWCGAAIVALGFLLVSSVFGAIAVPNHTELERALTPSPPTPTPIPTSIPTPIPQPASSQSGGNDIDVMLLVALLVVLATIGATLFAVVIVRHWDHNKEAASAPQPPALPPRSAGIPQPNLTQQLEAFSYTVRNDAFIAGKQNAREIFWRNEARKAADERAKREAAQAANVQSNKAREPAVMRNSRRLHAPPSPDEHAPHAGRRNGKAPHKDAGPRL